MHPAFKKIPDAPPHGLRLGDYLAMASYTERLPSAFRSVAEIKFAAQFHRDQAGAVGWLSKFTDPTKNRVMLHARNVGMTEDEIKDKARALFFEQQNSRKLAKMMKQEFEIKTERKIRRDLRRDIRQAGELIAMQLGLVTSGNQECVSKWSRSGREQQLASWLEWQSKTHIRDPDDIEIIYPMNEIAEMAQRSRHAEVCAYLKGLQDTIDTDGLGWMMVTSTPPGEFHANPKNGWKTKKWDGETTPKDGWKFIYDRWTKAMDSLRHAGISIAGFRAAEPQKDGTAHMHNFIVFKKEHERSIRAAIQWQYRYSKHAVNFRGGEEQGDTLPDGRPAASFASYAMMYALKALKGEATESDSWYSVWGIRRYQFIGLPTITTWRQLRKMREAPATEPESGMWRAVQSGDAATFFRLNGGLCCPLGERPCRISVKADPAAEIKLITMTRQSVDLIAGKKHIFRQQIGLTVRPIMHLIGAGGHRLNHPKKPLLPAENLDSRTYSEITQEKQSQKPTPPQPQPGQEIIMATPSKPWLDLHGVEEPDELEFAQDVTSMGFRLREDWLARIRESSEPHRARPRQARRSTPAVMPATQQRCVDHNDPELIDWYRDRRLAGLHTSGSDVGEFWFELQRHRASHHDMPTGDEDGGNGGRGSRE